MKVHGVPDRRSRSASPSRQRPGAGRPRYDIDRANKHKSSQQQQRNKGSSDIEASRWVAQEDAFVLSQAKKKARIRVREGRAKPIDWLALVVTFNATDENYLESDSSTEYVVPLNPVGLIESLSKDDIEALRKDLDNYIVLEKCRISLEFWKAAQILCKARQDEFSSSLSRRLGAQSVSGDVERLLSTKTRGELDNLEGQIKVKLRSGQEIDVEYWEHLLESLQLQKAKLDLQSRYSSTIENLIQEVKYEQADEAMKLQMTMEKWCNNRNLTTIAGSANNVIDPEPYLKIRNSDRGLLVVAEGDLIRSVATNRQEVRHKGIISNPRRSKSQVQDINISGQAFNSKSNQSMGSLYDREAAKGFEENEEAFAAEEEVSTKPRWQESYVSRKPKFFNRVQMGFEWNKYNQTHYDQDNPPPKVVQGYKFNVFYPDLIDKTRAPTYRIEREHGRKRGQSFALAGEEDTCIIRFTSGPPYEDIAFRIVDKEWDYSARRERGFKSSFDRGVLQLHFQFKKVYYRK